MQPLAMSEISSPSPLSAQPLSNLARGLPPTSRWRCRVLSGTGATASSGCAIAPTLTLDFYYFPSHITCGYQNNKHKQQAKFPDIAAMVAKGHALNLTVSWYGNACACKSENSYTGKMIDVVVQGAAQLFRCFGPEFLLLSCLTSLNTAVGP